MDMILIKDIMETYERILWESKTVRPIEKVDKDAPLSSSTPWTSAKVKCLCLLPVPVPSPLMEADQARWQP